MKQIVKTSRLAGQLEKLFRMLNNDFFDGQLPEVVVTIQATSRAWGHYSTFNAWDVKDGGKREINIAAGGLDRPIEQIIATLMHEMVHEYNDLVLNVQDCSNKGVYHNKHFKEAAEAHGLIVTRSEKNGWSYTEPGDALIEWILENDIPDIQMHRNEPGGLWITGGDTAANGGTPINPPKKSSSIRYHCPVCGAIARTTRPLNLICGDCIQTMITE